MNGYSNPIEMLQEEICKVIDYHREESDLTYAELVGVLEVIKYDILQEMEEE